MESRIHWRKFIFLLALLPVLASCGEEKPAGGWHNHDPSVKFTGKKTCATCHDDVSETFLHTGMGHSFYKPDPATAIEDFGPASEVHDPASKFSYRPFWINKDLYIKEFRLEGGDTIYSRVEKIDYVVGSGNQTRSYLIDRGGYFYEVPITWYVAGKKWDLSPGYDAGQNSRFSREIGLECMACHNERSGYVEGTENYFGEIAEGIGCESCHGPGELHIQRMEAGEEVDVGTQADPSIVNPAKLDVNLQFDVCMQCHLQGFNIYKEGKSLLDFRPGMKLTDIMDVVVEQSADENQFGIASHAQRLMQSKCFLQSGQKLTCTTCHNPHKSVHVTDPLVYEKQCISCHGTAQGQVSCSATSHSGQAMTGNCVKCHMVKGGTTDIPHVTFTDHKIRVLTDTSTRKPVNPEAIRLVCATRQDNAPEIMAHAWLLYFERNSPDPKYLDLALKDLSPANHSARAAAHYYKGQFAEAEKEIIQALQQRPGDPWLMFRKGEILEGKGDLEGAREIYSAIYAAHPLITDAGVRKGILVLKTLKDRGHALAEAEKIFAGLDRTKPGDEKILSNHGYILFQMGRVREAEQKFRQALALNPLHLLARENLILLLMNQGLKTEARKEFEQLKVFVPGYEKRAQMEMLLK